MVSIGESGTGAMLGAMTFNTTTLIINEFSIATLALRTLNITKLGKATLSIRAKLCIVFC